MPNQSNYDYEQIDRPYVYGNLERSPNGVLNIGAEGDVGSFSGGADNGTPNQEVQQQLISGQELNNLWIETWIKSRAYKPKSAGFLLEGRQGYIECMKLYVGQGGIEGGSIYIPNRDSPTFSVDEDGNLVATSATISGYIVENEGTFGGSGSDGTLEVSSGTTTIDLGNANLVTKNYSSISITGTGAINFQNPATGGTIVILKSQGAVEITSSAIAAIDLVGMGAQGGAGGAGGNPGAAGADGNNPDSGFVLDTADHYGIGGDSGGTANAAFTNQVFYTDAVNKLHRRCLFLCPGTGGGGGAGGTSAAGPVDGGAGGGGGGGLIIECAGDLNFTGTIDVSGEDGDPGSDYGGANGSGGGGGGGGSYGMAVILYETATSTAGTVKQEGGAGGQGGAGAGSAPLVESGGGGARSFQGAGGGGGGVGPAGNGDTGAGGGGGSGKDSAGNNAGGNAGADASSSVVAQNHYFR